MSIVFGLSGLNAIYIRLSKENTTKIKQNQAQQSQLPPVENSMGSLVSGSGFSVQLTLIFLKFFGSKIGSGITKNYLK